MITDTGILIFIFLISFISCCLNLAILLFLYKYMSNKNCEDRIKEREKMLMRFMIIIGIIALMGLCNAQEESIDPFVDFEDPPITILPDKPVVFHEAMERAGMTICIWFQNATCNGGNCTIDKLTIDEYLNLTNATFSA